MIRVEQTLHFDRMGKQSTGEDDMAEVNTGDRNTGDRNTGHLNTGHLNTGDRNTGNWNTGDLNTGHRNTGDLNTGDRNTGDRNTGNRNTGHWNTGHRNTGFFCVETPFATLFDKPTNLTHEQVRDLIPYVELPVGCEWVSTDKMTHDEKNKNPSHTTTGGFLRVLCKSIQEAFPLAWSKLGVEVKKQFHNLPNFDADKFLACTGVDVRKDADLYPQVEVKEEQVTEIILNGKKYKLTPISE